MNDLDEIELTEEAIEAIIGTDIRTCDGKTLDTYLNELGNIANSSFKTDDNTMAFTFILDSLGPVVENNIKKKEQ